MFDVPDVRTVDAFGAASYRPLIRRTVLRNWCVRCAVAILAAVVGALYPVSARAKAERAAKEPCSLLTEAEARQIGKVATARTPNTSPINCTYMGAAAPGSPQKVRVTLEVRAHGSLEDMWWKIQKDTWNRMKSEGSTAAKLVGIGDEAYFARNQDAQNMPTRVMLFVRKGITDFTLEAVGPKLEPLDAMKDVARKIADNL